jgi:hypothetical protein
MLLGQFVVGEVDGGEAVPDELALDALGLVAALDGQPDEDMRHALVGDAVVELGHRAGRSVRRSA